MKNVLFAIVFTFLINLAWSQTASHIYVNPTDNYQGTKYAVPNGSGSYTVLKNNTIYSIAKMHGMSIANLKDMNGLYGNIITIGQVLKVNATSTIGSGLNINGSASDASSVVETVSGVAVEKQVFSSSSSSNHAVWKRAAILKEEGQDIESLKGQEVPRGDSALWYVAGNEDNYHSIATTFDMSFEDLKASNEMGDYLLESGMVLIVVPGKLYGMKEMPEIMPELAPEKILTTEEAEAMMKDQEAYEMNETEVEEEVEAIENAGNDVISNTTDEADDFIEDTIEDVEDFSDEVIEDTEEAVDDMEW